MKILFNGKILEEEHFRIPLNDRAFRYGDGLFETILFLDGKIKLLSRHVERLTKGLNYLRLESLWLTTEQISYDINHLLEACGIKSNARIKVMVWRKEGGLYEPASYACNYMINAHLLTKDYDFFGELNQVGISENVRNYQYELSGHKTISAVRYILAGLEKKEKEWDDIIILNNEGYVSEGLQSNIFFVKNKFFLTPSLETGCIEGIMRNFILDVLKSAKVRTGEVTFEKEDLMEAEQIFLCNASGIRFIKEIEGKKFSTKVPSALVEVFKHYDQKD